MVIGILTYHRSHNFGALLQAIALKNILVSWGHNVYFIDYWPNYHKSMYSLFSIWRFRQLSFRLKIRYLKEKIYEYPQKYKSHKKYIDFIKSNITPYCKNIETEYDCIIYGSDQIWRKQPYLKTFNPIYFAKNSYKSYRHIAYSASMGIINLDDSEKNILRNLLSNFSRISVREKDLKDVVNALGYECELTLDPVLLIDKSRWDKIFPIEGYKNIEKYVLFVNYIPQSFKESTLREYAKRRNLKFIKVNGSVIGEDTPDAITSTSPIELLNIIRGAEVVFTSSFHAMIFSIIYEKEFYAAFSNNSKRAINILEQLSIEDRLIGPNTVLDDAQIANINYNYIKDKLEELRMPSISYLKSNIR